MQTKIIHILVGVTICGGMANTYSQDTNALFLPQERPVGIYESVGANRAANDLACESAIKNGECQPAEMDPSGHWGIVTNGFQLSVRSITNVFVYGKAIPVAVILRNTTANQLSAADVSRGSEAIFDVENVSGHPVQNRGDFNQGTSFYGFKDILPRRQVKYEFDLAAQYLLEPGIYEVRAGSSIKGPTGFATVPSGVLEIKVVAP